MQHQYLLIATMLAAGSHGGPSAAHRRPAVKRAAPATVTVTPAQIKRSKPEVRRWLFLQAAVHGELANVEACLAGGVDVNTMMTSADAPNTDQPAEKRFGTALFFAVSVGNMELSRLLLAHGARPDLANDDGETVLHWLANTEGELGQTAKRRRMAELVHTLVGQGKALDARDKRGRTPLMNAASSYSPNTVKLLLDEGADVALRDRDGATALHRAAAGPVDRSLLPRDWARQAGLVIHTLVARGADLTARNQQEHTPRDYAKKRGLTQVVRILERLGRARTATTGPTSTRDSTAAPLRPGCFA